VASKAAMFGFSDGYVVGNSVAKDMNIVMVAAIYRRNPTAVVVLKESDIKALRTSRPVNRDSQPVRRNSSNGRPWSKGASWTAAKST